MMLMALGVMQRTGLSAMVDTVGTVLMQHRTHDISMRQIARRSAVLARLVTCGAHSRSKEEGAR